MWKLFLDRTGSRSLPSSQKQAAILAWTAGSFKTDRVAITDEQARKTSPWCTTTSNLTFDGFCSG